MLKISIFLVINIFAGVIFANTEGFYIGSELGKTNFSHKKRYGGDVFRNQTSNYNFIFGYNRNSFNYELNYSFTHKQRGIYRMNPGNYYPGETAAKDLGYDILSTSFSYRYPTVMVGKQFLFSGYEKVGLSINAGLVYLNYKSRYEVISDEVDIAMDQEEINQTRRTFNKNKIIPHFSLVTTYQIKNKFNLRLSANYLLLSSIKATSNQDEYRKIKLRNGLSLNFGATYTI